MQVFAYRATERGIANNERAQRMAAQRAAWEAQEAAKEAQRQRAIEAEARRLATKAELRALGVALHMPYHTIEARALKVFGVTRSALRSNRRHRKIVFARQFIAYWSVRLTNLSLPQIGRLMGGFDHTTILHGKRAYPDKRAIMGRHLRRVR